MIKYFESLLFEKTKETQSEILFAQWNYDKKLIPSALHAVSTIFPHYSLHDESHSITIINNISRVLGKQNIDKLSAIDIWLILEASYCHDLGMVITNERLIESINSTEFIEFVKEISQDPKNGLHEFANRFDIIDKEIKIKDTSFNIELYDGIKFILAEFLREKHSDYSKMVIDNPLEEISLVSPRGVIPQRIFNILGNICLCHTKDFSNVLKLSFSEVGIDIEDAHPRFIACLLRVGDLLDLDSNRFSDVMLRTLSKVPLETLKHKAKHLSIESFRVDRELIEITAKCENYETASLVQHWFNYLNTEISNQMINWNKIVPFKELGYLPTIGNLKVELINYDYIDGKNKPKFTVDPDKALSLLKGAGIYNGPYQCIREILQNSVDASLIRMWLDYSKEYRFPSPQDSKFIQLVEEYPIIIDVSEKGIEEGWKNWEIEIQDSGIGISNNDLKYLMNTGSSSKNRFRTKIIENMPTWMKPSGSFGIGFQSIFMMTDLVKIKSKSYFTSDLQFIELYSPGSNRDGEILVKRETTTHGEHPGIKISINHKTKALPVRYSINAEHKNAMRIANNFDPFSNESLDIEMGKVIDEILYFSQKSYFPIKLAVNNDVIETFSDKKKFSYYDDVNCLELNIDYKDKKSSWKSLTYYKNQIADNKLEIEFLGFDINIHKDTAIEVLTLNRNEIRPKYEEKLKLDFFKSAFKIITKNFEEIFQSDESKCIGSMFLQYYADKLDSKEYNIKKYNQWRNLELEVGEKSFKLNNLLKSADKIKIVFGRKKHEMRIYDEYNFKEKELEIIFYHGRPLFSFSKFFLIKAVEYFPFIEKISDPLENTQEVILTKEKQETPFPDIDSFRLIKKLKENIEYSSARSIIPCPREYFNLRLKDDAHKDYVYHHFLSNNIYFPFPKMMSPYIKDEIENNKWILKKWVNKNLIDWVYQNRFDSNVMRTQIEEAYETFCNAIDLEKINDHS